MNTSIQDKALIVYLNFSAWTARKYDPKATRAAEESANTHDAGRFNKALLAKNALQQIVKADGVIYTFHRKNTLAWDDNGGRLLPSAHFLYYTQEIKKLITGHDVAVDDFCLNYPSLKEEAKIRLNGWYNESEYPADVRSKFDVKLTFLPVPATDDFRLSLSAEEIEGLKQDLQIEINDRVTAATKDIWDRIKQALGAMVGRLSDAEAIFRDSLVNNIQDLIGLLPKLNLSNDPAINDTIKEMNRLIVPPDSLRSDAALRQKTADDAAAILAKVSAYF